MWPFNKKIIGKKDATVPRTRKRKNRWLTNVVEKIKNEKQLFFYQSIKLVNWGIIVILLGVFYVPTMYFSLLLSDKITFQQLQEAQSLKKPSKVVPGTLRKPTKENGFEKATNKIIDDASKDLSYRTMLIGFLMVVLGVVLMIVEAMSRAKNIIKPTPPAPTVKIDLGKRLEEIITKNKGN